MTASTDGLHALRLGYSPDPDDAFMWWAIASPGESARLPTPPYRFQPVVADVQTLNDRAERVGDLEITGISAGAYPSVAGRYRVTCCGASFGIGYGPRLVARRPIGAEALARSGVRIASPGSRTTAALVTMLALDVGPERLTPVPFEQTIDRTLAGEFDAAIVIHEGQLTFERAGLHLVLDLGAWWEGETGLPLPLGLNVIRRDLDDQWGPGTIDAIERHLSASIEYGLSHRTAALKHASRFGRGISDADNDAFVRMYVNEMTRDMGDRGRQAIDALIARGAARGLCPAVS